MSDEVSHASVAASTAPSVTTLVSHPRLLRTDADSIRVFLRLYDQYCCEVVARVQKITQSGTVMTESVRPVNLKYCVDPEYLESVIALGFLKDVDDYESLSDETLRSYLDDKAKQCEEAATLDSLEKVVGAELQMYMTDPDARSRMECLLAA